MNTQLTPDIITADTTPVTLRRLHTIADMVTPIGLTVRTMADTADIMARLITGMRPIMVVDQL